MAEIVLVGLLVVSCLPIISDFLGKFREVFALFALIFIIIRFLAEMIGRRGSRMTLICCYVVIWALYSLAIFTGPIYDQENISATFFVILVVTPFLIVDAPVRIALSSTIASVFFIVISLINKRVGLFGYDVINCVVFLTTSVMLGTMWQKLKIQQMLYTHKVEVERDTDGLTKLLTKDAGRMRIERQMKMMTKQPGALIIFDLDNFKEVNDSCGHLIGDAILSAVGRILRQSFRAQDIMARFGGDEFVIYMSGVANREPVQMHTEQIREQMTEVAAKLPDANTVSCSFGVAFFPKDGSSYDELFVCADKALYSAKQNGKDRLRFY